MSLDKGVEFGKEKRKKYRGSKAIDKTCRNNGSCPHCERGRQHKNRKQALLAAAIEEENMLPLVDDFDMYAECADKMWRKLNAERANEEWYEYDRIRNMAAEMED